MTAAVARDQRVDLGMGGNLHRAATPRRWVLAIAARVIDAGSNSAMFRSASVRSATTRRCSNGSKSIITKVSTKPKQDARETATAARRRHPERTADLVGAELGDVAQGDQGSVGRIERREDTPQIGAGDTVGQR